MTSQSCPAAEPHVAPGGTLAAGPPRPSAPMTPARRPVSDRVALMVWLCLCGIWGSTWLAIKLGLRDLPPLTFAGIRFALAGLILLAVVAARRLTLPRTAREWWLLAYTGLLTITINYALVFWGEQHISSGLAAVLSATVPLFGLPLAHWLLASEPLTARKVVGVVLGVVGVLIICSGQLGVGGPLALWASIGVVLASLATAHAGVLIKASGTHIEPSMLAGIQMMGGCVPLLIVGSALEGNPLSFHWTPRALAALGYLVVPGSVMAFLMYYWLIRHTAVTWVLMIPLMTPLIAVLFGVMFGGETVGWHTAVGGAAVIAGVGIAAVRLGGGSTA